MSSRKWYLLKQWLSDHKPAVDVHVTVSVPEKEKVMGQGWVVLSKAQLLKAAGLQGDFLVEGAKWRWQDGTLKLTLQSEEIPWMGGQIVETNPVRTEKQLRDAEVAKRLQDTDSA